jgi:hypothetical protein
MIRATELFGWILIVRRLDEECITEKEKRLIEELELIVTELRDVLVCITILWSAVSSVVYVRLTACSGRKLICRRKAG